MEVTKIVFEEEDFVGEKRAPAVAMKSLARLKSKKDLTREALWERRRRHAMRRERSTMQAAAAPVAAAGADIEDSSSSSWTDKLDTPFGGRQGVRPRTVKDISKDDVDELMGSIDLGFDFDEEDGGRQLCQTLPALDLYFAINRSSKKLNYSSSNASTPSTAGETPSTSLSNETRSPTSPIGYDSWQLLQSGDTPENIKTKLKHWARVVACTARRTSSV